MTVSRYDALVIGAGFGGLGAALRLAERGARVVVCETVGYPGGCASSFERGGLRYDAGATLLAGFGPGQLFADWNERFDWQLDIEPIDPVVELRTDRLRLPISSRRERLVAELQAQPGAPKAAIERFFKRQRSVANALWPLLENPHLLPPLGFRGTVAHALRMPRYLPLLGLAGRPLATVVERDGVAGFEPLRVLLDAACQITVQCDHRSAEAPFALSALDYFHRGAVHLPAGIGSVASAMADTIRRLGGEIRYHSRVRSLRRHASSWTADTKRGAIQADAVFCNMLPQAVRALIGETSDGRLERLTSEVEEGWGAGMLYLALEDTRELRDLPHHLEIVDRTDQPFDSGNHIFVSVGSAQETPNGARRTATVSTHVPLRDLRELSSEDRGTRMAAIQAKMKDVLARHAPEIRRAIDRSMTASPRTFDRFTGRPEGWVGGRPRRAGWHNYKSIGPTRLSPGLWLVGDSVFPGQSALACALGGYRAAEALLRS